MTPEDRSLILQIAGLVITAIVGYFVKRQSDRQATIERKVDDVVLKFDPLTRTLDGQLEKIKETIRSEAGLQARSDLLAEQAVIAAAVASATLPQVMANLPAPIPVKVVAEEPVPVMVTQGEKP